MQARVPWHRARLMRQSYHKLLKMDDLSLELRSPLTIIHQPLALAAFSIYTISGRKM
jgi:hypothetical protein